MKGKKKNPKGSFVYLLCYLVVGVVLGVLFAENGERWFGGEPWVMILAVLGLFVASILFLWLHVILHELGHLVCGLVSGYRLLSFRFGGFIWQKERGRVRCKRSVVYGIGGQCLMTPPDKKPLPYRLYHFGGVLFNLLFSAAAIGGCFAVQRIPVALVLFVMFAVFGLTTAFVNGVPMLMNIPNDGKNLVELGKDEQAREAYRTLLWIEERLAKGERLNEMPSEWFIPPSEEARRNYMTAQLSVMACNRLMDEGKLYEAMVAINELLESDASLCDLHRGLLACDLLTCELLFYRREWFDISILDQEQMNFLKTMAKNPSVLRTEYALALIWEGDFAKGEELRRTFEKVAMSYPYMGDVVAERELLITIFQEAKEIWASRLQGGNP